MYILQPDKPTNQPIKKETNQPLTQPTHPPTNQAITFMTVEFVVLLLDTVDSRSSQALLVSVNTGTVIGLPVDTGEKGLVSSIQYNTVMRTEKFKASWCQQIECHLKCFLLPLTIYSLVSLSYFQIHNSNPPE